MWAHNCDFLILVATGIIILGCSDAVADTLIAADGRALERTFVDGPPLEQTIVVCSDRPEVFTRNLERFAAYVLPDRKYIVIDATDRSEIDTHDATLLYIGSRTKNESIDCLAKISELASFVSKKIEQPFPEIPGLPPESSATPVLLYSREQINGNDLAVAICYGEANCNAAYVSLFMLAPEFCQLNFDCDFVN